MNVKLIVGVLFSQLFTFSACHNDMAEPKEDSLQMLIGSISTSNIGEYSSELSYTLCLFQAPISSELNDSDFKCTEINRGLNNEGMTEADLKEFTFKVPHSEKVVYAYRLFVHATPKAKPETAISISVGADFSALEIGLIKDVGENYVPLSKDNYYAYATETGNLLNVIAIELNLQRFVGRMVFDIFKSDSDRNPIDIDAGYGSTLDRVTQINVVMNGITTGMKPADKAAVTKHEDATTSLTLETVLEESNFQLDVKKQDTEYFLPVLGKQEANIETKGGVRLFSVFLLPTGMGDKNGLKANLTFEYEDEPDNTGKKNISLNLPSSSSSSILKVAENCYTLTNIRLKNNRIIDINVLGGVDIETEWGK